MYYLSTNYEQLYISLCEGKKPVCYVDHTFNGREEPMRDICECRIKQDGSICFGVRGHQYGGVDEWEFKIESERKHLFIEDCKRLNVEWIDPLQRPEGASNIMGT